MISGTPLPNPLDHHSWLKCSGSNSLLHLQSFSSLLKMMMKLFVAGLVAADAASHEDIVLSDWQTESAGKSIFLEMYASW